MHKNLIPTYSASTLYEVEPRKIAQLGYKYLFMDIDNTFDSYKEPFPQEKAYEFAKKAKEYDLKIIFASNNYEKRVKIYSNKLGLNDYIYFCLKPNSKKIDNYIRDNNIDRKKILFIGDQLLADVKVGNKLKVDTLLVTPLTDVDQWFTKVRRIFEKPILKHLKKNNKLKEWEN